MVFVVVFVVLPMVSLVLRVKKRTGSLGPGLASGGGITARDVRRRLGNGANVQGGGVGAVSIWRRVWEECVRTVEDTVRMGGKGLV